MSKFCPLCNEVTNCTDNCHFCLEEDENAWNEAVDFGGGNKMPKHTPCDTEPFECPFNAQYSDDCRYYCGLGVDEDEPEDYEDEEGERNNDI